MKFNVEISLDWIDDEDTIDSAVERRIVDAVADRILAKAQQKIEAEVKKSLGEIEDTIGKRAIAQIEGRINKTMDDWLGDDVTLTDTWGKPTWSGKLVDLIRTRFDEFWQQKVDSKGTVGGYGKTTSRLEWVIDKRIIDIGTTFAKDLAAEVETQVKSTLSARLKAALGDELIKNLGVPRLLESMKLSSQ